MLAEKMRCPYVDDLVDSLDPELLEQWLAFSVVDGWWKSTPYDKQQNDAKTELARLYGH